MKEHQIISNLLNVVIELSREIDQKDTIIEEMEHDQQKLVEIINEISRVI